MTHEQIAEQLYDELQHNKITNYNEYSDRLYELLDKAHPNEERVGCYVAEVEDLMHNKWSFGFCDMCGEVIFYDDDQWYDIQMAEPDEQDILEETLPKYQNEVANIIQDVCPTCWHKLLKKGDDMERPTEVDFSERRIPDEIWETINEVLAYEYEATPSGYSIELKITNIDWD